MRRVGIIGLGSIGRRHARILRSLSGEIEVFAYRTRHGALRDSVDGVVDLDREVFLSTQLDLVVISNPSAFHLASLAQVLDAGIAGTVVVEKPFCLPSEAAEAKRLIAAYREVDVLPANCLRFHPAVAVLKDLLAEGRAGGAVECYAHFGTYMPGWHPWEDYRSTYAARSDMGGGVLLTSIHEIDLMHHLFGEGQVVGARVGTLVLSEIDVEDSAHVLMTLERCAIANVSLNFFERPADRYLKVALTKGTFFWRFGEPVAHVAYYGVDRLVEEEIGVDPAVDAMYEQMWARMLEGETRNFEMESVFRSLETVAAVKAIGEQG